MSAASSSRVSGDQRHTRANPCPICGGGVDDKQGQGIRCAGYTSPDREYARCSREEYAGGAAVDQKCQPPCYIHKLKGDCKCGRTHGVADVIPYPSKPAPKPAKPAKPRVSRIRPESIEATYDYTDGTGAIVAQKLRLHGKRFVWRRPDPAVEGQWLEGLGDLSVDELYRLDRLIAAHMRTPVWYVEGEKDVHTLESFGFLATTGGGGGNKWPASQNPRFRDRDVIFCGDNDDIGRRFIKEAAESLKGIAKSIRIVDLKAGMKKLGLPDLPLKGDVSDFLAMGGTREQLISLAESAKDPFKIEFATLADADALLGETTWLWPQWIPDGNMSLLAAVAGGGKTRTALDLCRRLYFGLEMPDGAPNRYPAGTRTLWLMYDLNWSMSADVAKSYGIPLEAIILGAAKDSPLVNPDFDDPRTMAFLEAIVRQEKPGLIVIDTVTYATRRNTAKAEETKVAFDGIMKLAGETGVAVLALTHLNKEGEVLNRRIVERARSVISLSKPDPEGQPDRRKLWVSKSAVKAPEALGITFAAGGNTYDDTPPEDVESFAKGKPRGPAPTKSLKDAQWVFDQLSESPGPIRVGEIVERAKRDGILKVTNANPTPSISPLYACMRRIPNLKPGWMVDELKIDNRAYWHLKGPQQVDESSEPSGDF